MHFFDHCSRLYFTLADTNGNSKHLLNGVSLSWFLANCPAPNSITKLTYHTVTSVLIYLRIYFQICLDLDMIAEEWNLSFPRQKNCLILDASACNIFGNIYLWFTMTFAIFFHNVTYIRVANVVTVHDDLLTQWRYINE